MPEAPVAPTSAPSAPAAPAAPSAPPKVTNPFEESFAALDRFADPEPPETPAKPTPAKPAAKPAKPETKSTGEKPTPKPAKAVDPEEEETEHEQPAKPEEETKPAETETKPVATETKPGKASPWKLVESYKKTNTQLQQEIAELRNAHKPGELPKEFQERFTALENRNKELENEIRFTNYSKSKEFIDTYQKPYEEAWTNAISDLKELVITNDDGTSRPASVQDLLALSNMPLGQARATAKAWFGDSADDVMSHRRNLRELSDKQSKALEDSKKFGGERDQQRQAEMQAKHKARSEELAKVWSGINEEAVAKYEYLRPVEGQTERNEKLDKAINFVDETLKKNVGQAKTQEERDQILRQHAAVRNRAIGFSVLKHENVGLRAKVAELEKALAEFQGSEPTNGDPRRPSNGEATPETLDGAVAGLARYAT